MKKDSKPATRWLFTKNRSYSCTMSGAWRAVAFCTGCAVIFHSPLGCTHVASLMDMGAQYRSIGDRSRETMDAVPLVSSNLREKDCIFGGTNRLRSCIAYVMGTYAPRCLIIATSCVAGVIGDDVQQEADDAEAEYQIPVLCVPYGGFLGGEYADGYFQTLRLIAQRFLRPQAKQPGSVLLLGDQMGPWGQYAREVKRLLEYFDLEVRWQFPGYVPFAEWPDMTSASLLIPLNYAGQTQGGLEQAVREWEKDFGTPAVHDIYPVGWKNTCLWLRRIAELTGNPARGETAISAEEKRLADNVAPLLHTTKGKKAVLGIGRGPRWYNPSETLETIYRLQLHLSAVVLYDKLQPEEKEATRRTVQQWLEAKAPAPSSGGTLSVPILENAESQQNIDRADILLTTDEIMNTKARQLFIPMVPLAGTEGELVLMRSIYRLLCRYGAKGGIVYA